MQLISDRNSRVYTPSFRRGRRRRRQKRRERKQSQIRDCRLSTTAFLCDFRMERTKANRSVFFVVSLTVSGLKAPPHLFPYLNSGSSCQQNRTGDSEGIAAAVAKAVLVLLMHRS